MIFMHPFTDLKNCVVIRDFIKVVLSSKIDRFANTGFHIGSFAAAFWGAIVLSLLNVLLKWLAPAREITD